ncbi:WavE lipopolysaccharide synthesis family protein [Photobacterium sp. GB-27]|uniref:WavE lipopolysaccharide synthesis family protein n=1 Tax=Photobacterium sp. GB-27 TaxID=2022109 RepID=UPI001E412B26|nr:WavE lipopolysaccharide synthesis family protein [Photobacterium sp. GB-27]
MDLGLKNNNNSIPFEEITVVVQGPVQTFADRQQEDGITQRCLRSVRQMLPGAHIILSTWKDQDLAGLDYDQLVISEDPGPNTRYYKKNGTPQHYNNNRQIVSTLAGLKQVQTKYVVKLRSDNYLESNDFINIQQQYKSRCDAFKFLKERVVVPNIFTRKYAKGHRVAFHVSDFFYFGLTEDVLALWQFELIPEFTLTKPGMLNDGYPDYPVDCTQLLFLNALKQFDPTIHLNGLLDNNKHTIYQSELCMANNLVVASAEDIGLGLCKKFKEKVRVSKPKGKCAHYQYREWQELYKKYCDARFDVNYPLKEKLGLFFERCLYVFPVYFETKINLCRRTKFFLKNNKLN